MLPQDKFRNWMLKHLGQETGCDYGMLIAVYKCLFGIVKTVADDFEFGTSQIISLSE